MKWKEMEQLPPCNQHSGWRHPPAKLGPARVKWGASHSWLPQSWGRELCPCQGSLLRGLGNCMMQGRTQIKGCGSLVAPPTAILLLSLLSLCQCPHQ